MRPDQSGASSWRDPSRIFDSPATASARPPLWKLEKTKQDAAEYTDFCLHRTAELQRDLDDYLRAFLRAAGAIPGMQEPVDFYDNLMRNEPIVWSPPREETDRENSLGPELADINVSGLHEMTAQTHITLSSPAR